MKIENYLVPIAYKTSRRVFNGEIKLTEGRKIIVGENRMNSNSAADYINNFKYLIQGKKFTRTLNYFSMEYFLSSIHKDYGRYGLANSIKALKKHIEYYEKKQNTTMRKMRSLVEKYDFVNTDRNDNELQKELIEEIYKTNTSRKILIKELNSYSPNKRTVQKLTKSQIRIRDNSIIAKLKIVRNFECQICKVKIAKSNGSFYIEAAHIKPKRENGNEAPSNILILCPNHHKEFDYGKLKIIKHTKNIIQFTLNNRDHRISLKLE